LITGEAERGSETLLLERVRALEPQIQAATDFLEKECYLPDNLFEGLRKTGMFRVSWWKSFGGLELDPLTQLDVFEELSRFNGSVGWIGTFGGLTGLIAAMLEPAAVPDLFPSPDHTAAGQYAPMGRAEKVPGGFKVTGRWSFGSGCRHAHVIHSGCVVFENGSPRIVNGQPEIRQVAFLKEKCELLPDSWNTIGMRGTGSYDYTVNDLFVPYEHSFSYFAPPRREEPLYAFPALFLYSHLPVPLGIARSSIETFIALSAEKRLSPSGRFLREDSGVQEMVAEAEAALSAARSYAHEVLEDFWETARRGDELTRRQRAIFRIALVYVTRVCKDVVASMFDAAASSSIRHGNPLDIQMRDMLTLSQHRVVQSKTYKPGGRILLGLETNDPFF
jgi:alkylation response protein AidB-like acyl-CoA dehydrogenase